MMTRSIVQVCSMLLVTMAFFPGSLRADTYNIPFSDLQQIIEDSNDSPDAAIRAYLASLIRDELIALGFAENGGIVLEDIPLDEMTHTFQTNCNLPQPFQIHTDATTASVELTDDSGLTANLDSIRSINLHADLAGTLTTQATAWVRWGQDIIFVGNCVKFETDHGWVGITMPFDIDLDLSLDLNPGYDADLLAIVVDKQATLTGQALLSGGDLQHDFGSFSLTDVIIDLFEDDLLDEGQAQGELAVADAIATQNFRLDGLDENGLPDSTIVAFNGPTVFALDVSAEDQPFVRDLLAQFGIPEIMIEILDERGIEILLQLAILEGAERDAYLAQLGVAASCDLLLSNFEVQLDSTPLYNFDGQSCVVADIQGPAAAAYFTDSLCADEIAFQPQDPNEFCNSSFGDQAADLLGNAASWVADANQPNDPLPAVPSRSWSTTPSTQLDLGVVSSIGNFQPFMKQIKYKTVVDLPRGNGECELEMRVYKKDISAEGLKPLMALHGGTWRNRGFSFVGLEAGISQLTERGFIVFAPFYRLVDSSDGNIECNGATWREVTADVESALDWIMSNGAALGASNEPVSVYGQSAGAHLGAWLAARRSTDIRKAAIFYAPTDSLEFLSGAAPLNGPYESFRLFGMRSMARFYGAQNGSEEILLDQIDYATLTPASLASDWNTLIPDTVFNLSQLDPLQPPTYLARCASLSGSDLTAVDLSAPPLELLECLKEDLSEFLVANSFNHQFDDTSAPVHLVHGSADTLVPYVQAVNLCAAIDGNPQSSEIVFPLTTYACGAASEVQIVQDAEHALELGVCLEGLCPGGVPGSATRDAAMLAIDNAYNWLVMDPPAPAPDAVAMAALPDVNGNGSADIALLLRGAADSVHVRDAATGELISDVGLGDDTGITLQTLPDLNGDGAAEIAVLGTTPSGQVRVRIIDSLAAATVNTIFYGSNYSAIDMAIVPDIDGNGVSEVAVMGRNASGGVRVQVRDALSDAQASTTFFGSSADPVNLQVLPDINGNNSPEVVVHARLASNGRSRAQIKDTASGALIRQVFFGAVYAPLQLAVVNDVSGDGLPDLAHLGRNDGTGAVRVQIKASSGGPAISNAFLGNTDLPVQIVGIGDANASGSPDTAILVERPDGSGKVVIRDGLTGDHIRNTFMGSIDSPAGLALVDDLDASGDPELAGLGEAAGVQRVQIRDSITGAQINNIDYP